MLSFWDFSIATFFILPVLVLFIYNLLPKAFIKGKSTRILAVLSSVLLLTGIISLVRFSSIDFIDFTLLWEMKIGVSSYFSIDLFSCIMLLCIALTVLVASLVGKDSLKEEKKINFTNLCIILMLAMNGLVLVTDMFSFYVFLEATGICTFVLIALYKDSDGLEGSFKYFVMSALATAFILIGLTFIFINVGSLNFMAVQTALSTAVLSHELLLKVGLAFLLAGLCIKAGITPFHGWVPDAYQSASAPVSVLLGGIVTKICGIYGLIRIFGILITGYTFISNILMIFALSAILFGAFAALGQNNFKRILAYSSISQLGYIALGVATGSALGIIGAVLHVFNHTTFKGTMFVNAAAIENELKTLDINEMGGLAKQMPVTGISSVLAFLSAAGLPPLAGFWSKLLIIIAVWNCGWHISAGVALFAGVLTLAYFLRLQRKVFFGKVQANFSHIKENSRSNKLAAIILTIITVAFGVIIPLTLSFLRIKGLL